MFVLQEGKNSIDMLCNPCDIDFDPGFVDRIHALFNYADLDEKCLKTPVKESGGHSAAGTTESPDLDINFITSKLKVTFHVPKVDLRHPKEIPNFVR